MYFLSLNQVIKIVAISDTHDIHNALRIPKCDLLIFAGDCSENGTKLEIDDFLSWINTLDYELVIIVPGNHDYYFMEMIGTTGIEKLSSNILLISNSIITFKGILIGAYCYALRPNKWPKNKFDAFLVNQDYFNYRQNRIVDVLITHFPPKGMLDVIYNNNSNRPGGLDCINNLVQHLTPMIHIFGHIHDSRGSFHTNNCSFLNVSCFKKRSPSIIYLKTIKS